MLLIARSPVGGTGQTLACTPRDPVTPTSEPSGLKLTCSAKPVTAVVPGTSCPVARSHRYRLPAADLNSPVTAATRELSGENATSSTEVLAPLRAPRCSPVPVSQTVTVRSSCAAAIRWPSAENVTACTASPTVEPGAPLGGCHNCTLPSMIAATTRPSPDIASRCITLPGTGGIVVT